MKTRKKTGFALQSALWIGLIVAFGVTFSFAYPENIIFSGKKHRGTVRFAHEFHMEEFDCLDCHHDMENGENILDEADLEEGNPDIRCGSCHNDKLKLKKREAFHHQCIGCHSKRQMTGEAKGPIFCGECHIREKQ